LCFQEIPAIQIKTTKNYFVSFSYKKTAETFGGSSVVSGVSNVVSAASSVVSAMLCQKLLPAVGM
jgi:hypothetical protein